MHLYSDRLRTQLTSSFEVKCLDANDAADYNLSQHFGEIADFIEEGRKRGGVVVHCAAGVSRATTSTCAYLMVKEGLDLNSAYSKVFACRSVVKPNAGFWKQLRDFEEALSLEGLTLIAKEPDAAPVQPDGKPAALDRAKLHSRLVELDFDASNLDTYLGSQGPLHFLTAKVMPVGDISPNALCQQLRSNMTIPGCILDNAVVDGNTVDLRLRCALTMDGDALKALLETQPGIASAVCEAGTQKPINLRASVAITDYTWADAGAKVKIYIPLPNGALNGMDGVANVLERNFSETSVDVLVLVEPQRRLRLNHLAGEVEPTACGVTADQKKCRIVVTLVKKHDVPWENLTASRPS